MSKISKNFFELDYIDALSSNHGFLYKLDPRVKIITTLFFIIFITSFNKYTVSALIPFFIFPVFNIAIAGIPLSYILKKILLLSPFAIFVGIFNPFIDTSILFKIGHININGGTVSFLSILMRFVLSISAILILISITGFNSICLSLLKLGLPKPFVVQLMFIYRYLFILVDESDRIMKAKSLRTFSSIHKISFSTYISIIGNLFLRTIQRAQRIFLAMKSRGFNGEIPLIIKMHLGYKELVFMFSWLLLFTIFRFTNLSVLLGKFVIGN